MKQVIKKIGLTAGLLSLSALAQQQAGSPKGAPVVGSGNAQATSPAKKRNWSPDNCKHQAPRVKQLYEECLANKDNAKRRACVENLEGNIVGNQLIEDCKDLIVPIKNSMNAKEKAMYPEPKPVVSATTNAQSGWTAEKCQKPVPNLRRMADVCLNTKAADKRQACFEKIEKSFQGSGGWWESCRTTIDPIKAEFEAKERQKYPAQQGTQQSAQKGGSDKQNQGANTQAPQVPQKECEAAGKKARSYAEGCLKQKTYEARSQCFAGFDQKTGIPSHVFEGCRQVFEPLKAEIKGKEKSLYPNQPSAVDEEGGGKK